MKKFIEFQEKIGELKHLRRTGWVLRGVEKPETVASHSWRMAIMAIQKEEELKALGINVDKVIEMCLIHDVSEAIVGDIIPEKYQIADKKISKEEKKALEVKAIKEMAKKYNFKKLENLFLEHEEGAAKEAITVQNLDKLDMLLQAYEYKLAHPDIERLNEFMENSEHAVTMPIFAKEVAEIKHRQNGGKANKNNFIDFQILIGKLKHLERSGPKMYGIKNPETVASHCMRSAVMIMELEHVFKAKGLNTQQMIRQAVLHDVGEAVIGDIAPEKWQADGSKKISKEEKAKLELKAIENMAEKYDVDFVLNAFNDVEHRKSKEGSEVKDIEIFEGIQQSYEYIKNGYKDVAILREWIPYHSPRIKSHIVKGLVYSVKKEQNSFLTSHNLPTFYQKGGR